MAPGPLLDSRTSSCTSSHDNVGNTRPRPAIPIIPIVPRKLENKHRQSPRGAKHVAPNANDSKNKDSIGRTADTPPRVREAVLSDEAGVDLNHEPHTQNSNGHFVKLPRPCDDAERFTFDLPPSFYPTRHFPDAPFPHFSTTSNGPSVTAPSSIHPRSRTDSGIVFGGFSESADPSPVLSPAVPLTFYPQAPLPVDTSQSVYHGYGHTHRVPEPFHGWPDYTQYPPTFGYHMNSPYDNRIPFMHPPDRHAPCTPTLPALRVQLQHQHRSDERPITTSSVASHSSNEPPPHVLAYPQDGNLFAAPHGRGEETYGHVHSATIVPTGAAMIQKYGVFDRSISLERDLDDHIATDHYRLSILADYLLDHFNNPSFSDCRLHITNTSGTFDAVEYSLHSLLVARNSKISELLDSAEPGVDGRKFLRMDIPDRFVTPMAFEAALRVYYGGPLMRQDVFGEGEQNLVLQGNGDLPRYHSPTSAMDHALAYAAAGCLLQVPRVAHRGIQIASRLLSWETIEKTISFALEGGLSATWTAEHHETETSPTKSSSTDSSKDHSRIDTPASTDETHEGSNISHPQSLPSLSPPVGGTYAPHADHLLRAALALLIQDFPPAFTLDASAPPQPFIDRLFPLAKPPSTKSRLSSIKFGDYSAQPTAAPDAPTTATLSGVLLSVPFVLLVYILDSLSENTRLLLLHPLVKERERRRLEVLACRSPPGTPPLADAKAWEAVSWEEFVAGAGEGEQSRSAATVERRWVGHGVSSAL